MIKHDRRHHRGGQRRKDRRYRRGGNPRPACYRGCGRRPAGEGIATPILVGHEEEIKAMLTGLGEAPADYEIIVSDTDQDCAAKAVALCAEEKPTS